LLLSRIQWDSASVQPIQRFEDTDCHRQQQTFFIDDSRWNGGRRVSYALDPDSGLLKVFCCRWSDYSMTGTPETDLCDGARFLLAGYPIIVTVGAPTLGNDRAYLSNHGQCADVFARVTV
jgi:hypothetical protein